LALLLQALKPSSSGAQDIMTTLGAMEKIQNVATNLLPQSSGDSDSPLSTVKALSPFAALLAQMMKKNESAPAAPQPALPNPNVAPAVVASQAEPPTPAKNGAVSSQVAPQPVAAPVAIDAEETKRSEMLANLREQLGMLAQIAPSKPDAKEVVANLLPMLPQEMDDMIYDTLSADNWFTRLCFIQPAIKPYEEWFTSVRNEILASFTEIDPNAPAPSAETKQ
jgi:hypothetical protein